MNTKLNIEVFVGKEFSKNYKSPDILWKKLGFLKTNLTIVYHWPTIQIDGSVKDVENTLQFWIKDL